ncbi:hypothetical protein ACSK1E_005521, partial [Escherichia coli]
MKKFHFFLVVGVVLFSLFSPVREWCTSDHRMPLLCRRFSPVAPDAVLPAHLTVCKATAPVCRRTVARSPQTDFPG